MYSPRHLRKSYNGSSRQSELLIHMRYPGLPDTLKEIPFQSTEIWRICRLFEFIWGKCTFSISLIYLSEYLFVCIHAPFLPTKSLKWPYSKNTNIEIKTKWNEKVGKCKYTWKIKTKKKKAGNMQPLGSTWVLWKGILFHEDCPVTQGKNGKQNQFFGFHYSKGSLVWDFLQRWM